MDQTIPVQIAIPDDLTFADLKLARDPDGAVSFDWAAIERICEASGIDAGLFKEQTEDNVAELITRWYAAHLAQGGGLPIRCKRICSPK